MLSPHVAEGYQIPLFHEVHADDEYLLNTIDGEWFELLHHFAWADYREHAAAYYDALYAFNLDQDKGVKDRYNIFFRLEFQNHREYAWNCLLSRDYRYYVYTWPLSPCSTRRYD